LIEARGDEAGEFAVAINLLLDRPDLREQMGAALAKLTLVFSTAKCRARGQAARIAASPTRVDAPDFEVQCALRAYMKESPGERVSLCVVVPCYNEEDVMATFFDTVVPELDRATGRSWRLLFVDDGSTDGTIDAIVREHLAEPRVTCISLSRNFGHQAAVSAGLAFAAGDYVGVIDGDLQDPVAVLIQLYKKAVEEHLDVCYGVRSRRDAPVVLRVAYRTYYKLIGRFAEHRWPRDAGDFCVMSDRFHRVVVSLPEHSRMMRGLRSWVGFKQAGLPYHRPARLHGMSKYNFGKLCALALHSLIAFSNIPLRLASFVGLLMGGGSLLFGLIVLMNRIFPRFTVFGYWVGANQGTATLLCFLAFVFSVLFICIGLIGEYLAILLQEVKGRPTAIVASVLGEIDKNALAKQISYTAVSDPSPQSYETMPSPESK
jgi:dolichol-phosphate mannosyltransferase